MPGNTTNALIRNRYDREMLALAVPALGTLAADPLVSVVDTIFVGRLGVRPLAALGVNTSVFSLAFVIFNFLAYGTTPLIARALGRADREEAGRVAVQALVLAAGIGALSLATLEGLAGPILGAMGATGPLRDPALAYLRIRALAGPAVLLITAGHGIFRGHHDTRTPLLVTLGLNGANLVLDPLFIFGFGWGIAGAAAATAVAQWSGAATFLVLIARRREALGIRPVLPRAVELLPFVRIGSELAVRTSALIGTLALATAIATRVGAVAVAAHQIAMQLWLLLALIVDAIAVAAQAMVARYRGAGRPWEARTAADRLLLWGFGTGIALALLFLALRPLLPSAFTSDPAVIAAVMSVYPFVVWMQPLNAAVFVWDGIFLGAEEFRFLAVQMTGAALVAGGALLLVLPFRWGLTGVWWGIVTMMLVRAGVLACRYFRGRSGGPAADGAA